MLIRTVIFALFVALSFEIEAQVESLIGKEKEEVMEIVKKDYKKFAEDNSVIKKQFNYLKYVNSAQSITWIIYFSDSDICTSTKKVCDYSEYDFVLMDLEDQCKQVADLEWEYSDSRDTYSLVLKEEDWYFTLRERRAENAVKSRNN